MINSTNIRQIFDYRPDGSLIWKIKPNKSIEPGAKVGAPDVHGYIQVMYLRKNYKLHRLIYLWHHGELPKMIDHINRNRSDNRIENLRAADDSLNNNNSVHSWGKSRFRGVSPMPNGKFRVQFQGKYLGLFETEKEASDFYEATRRKTMPVLTI